ncbi:MAG: prenyltransferase/squalene oxidase repeat-containing protein [Bythopirellula sp.]|nr:prenyltransferase/squalene oxidase repeat-containing protein [Bythopirellula sp.]
MERIAACFIAQLAFLLSWLPALAQNGDPEPPSTDILSEEQWADVDASVERGLDWLAKQQQRDGSFPTQPFGQPGVTGLCVLAFLAHGHTPGTEPYGKVIEKGVSYIADRQKPNGLIALVAPMGMELHRNVDRTVGGTALYNHGISSLTLSEVYSSTSDTSAEEIKAIIEKSIATTLTMQRWPKQREEDQGGWRYLDLLYTDGEPVDSNLSNTVWQMLFLRSAKNAGFDVPQDAIDGAVTFIKNCFFDRYQTFGLMPSELDHRTRGMSGAGVISLALAGMHDSVEAQSAGKWILENDFDEYNVVEPFGQIGWLDDRYHYGVFYCTQAMYQLGGHYWEEFFPPVVEVLLKNQNTDGSWDPESHGSDFKYGNVYTTALMVLSLGAPNQFLPVLQR